MLRKNKVFFTLSLVFLALALICAVFALVLGAELGNLGDESTDTDNAGNALGVAAAGILYAFFLVLFSVATWILGALSVLFSVLNLRTAVRWLRITSAIFPGTAALLCLATALSLFLRAA